MDPYKCFIATNPEKFIQVIRIITAKEFPKQAEKLFVIPYGPFMGDPEAFLVSLECERSKFSIYINRTETGYSDLTLYFPTRESDLEEAYRYWFSIVEIVKRAKWKISGGPEREIENRKEEDELSKIREGVRELSREEIVALQSLYQFKNEYKPEFSIERKLKKKKATIHTQLNSARRKLNLKGVRTKELFQKLEKASVLEEILQK